MVDDTYIGGLIDNSQTTESGLVEAARAATLKILRDIEAGNVPTHEIPDLAKGLEAINGTIKAWRYYRD